MPDRYYIIECHGWGIHPGAGAGPGNAVPGISYSILDRYWGHREVWRDYANRRGNRTNAFRLALVTGECERLNAANREWEAAA